MLWRDLPSSKYQIRGVQYSVQGEQYSLTWIWPDEVDFVYIYKATPNEEKTIEDIRKEELKLCSKDEYKKRGFIQRIDSVGKVSITIFPCLKEGSKIIPLIQWDEQNRVEFSSGRAKIYISLKYKKKLFQQKKVVQINIHSEIPIKRESLCYVQKRGNVPTNKEDGRIYPFVMDFQAGVNNLPPLEIDKDEYLRIFFTDGKKDGEIYEIIPV